MAKYSKLEHFQDTRDAQYFNDLLARRDEAIEEYSFVQRAIQKQKLKDSPILKNPANAELYEKFDSVPTPGMEDFEVCMEKREQIQEHVKRTVKNKCF